MSHPDMERERERRQWEDDEWRDHDEQQAAEARRDEKIEVRQAIPLRCCLMSHPEACMPAGKGEAS